MLLLDVDDDDDDGEDDDKDDEAKKTGSPTSFCLEIIFFIFKQIKQELHCKLWKYFLLMLMLL